MTFTEFNESKSGMVTKDALYPLTDKFPNEVVKMNFLSLCLVRYLFSIFHGK